MRALPTLVAIAASTVALVVVTGAGADSEDPSASGSGTTGPRHQILGDWKTGRRGRLEIVDVSGRVAALARRPMRLGRCRVPAGRAVIRALRFAERRADVDVWSARALVPRRGCEGFSTTAVRLELASDLRVRVASSEHGTLRRLSRIRPRPSGTDPVLGVWERNRGGIVVERSGRHYVGRAREAFLIGNGCTVPEGTAVWRLRPSAPGRYDGTITTFMPPPGCEPDRRSRSRWRLEQDGTKLLRESPSGGTAEYARPG